MRGVGRHLRHGHVVAVGTLHVGVGGHLTLHGLGVEVGVVLRGSGESGKLSGHVLVVGVGVHHVGVAIVVHVGGVHAGGVTADLAHGSGIGHAGDGVFVLLHEGLGLPSGAVLVVGVLFHVDGAEPLGFVDEGTLLRLTEEFPLGAKTLGYLRVMHLRILLCHLTALTT